MNQFLYSTYEISQLVSMAIDKKGWSLRSCCSYFNARYYKEIESGDVVKLDKDFVQRITSNQFKVISLRVVKLCEFLNVDLEIKQSKGSLFMKEFSQFDEIVESNPELEIKLKNY